MSSSSDEEEKQPEKDLESPNTYMEQNLTMNSLGLRRKGTVNRRATIFAGDFDMDDEIIQRNYTKNRNDLKRSEKLHIIQHKTVGKPRPYEIVVENQTNMMTRFLLHFLFTDHDHKMIDLFDSNDPIFENFKAKPNADRKRKSQLKVGDTGRFLSQIKQS